MKMLPFAALFLVSLILMILVAACGGRPFPRREEDEHGAI